MAQVPKNTPLFDIDKIGKPSVGQSEETKDIGSYWEMGIEVPIKNRKFERGTVLEYKVAPDPFNRNNVDVYDTQFGISAVNKGSHNIPSNFVQYGDIALLGPSNEPRFPNHSEHIKIASSGEVLESVSHWRRGVLYTLNRDNKFSYSMGDVITIYGTGCGDNWTPVDNISTLGIQKGVSSLNRHGKYFPLIDQVSSFESNMSSSHLAFSIQLPTNNNFTSHVNQGLYSRAWGQLGLIPWRSPDKFNKDTHDWFYETGDYSGIFRFLLSKNTDDEARAVYTTDTNITEEPYEIRIEEGYNTFLVRSIDHGYASIGDVVSQGTLSSKLYIKSPKYRAHSIYSPDVEDITIGDGINLVTIDPANTDADYWDENPTELAEIIVNAINSSNPFKVSAEIIEADEYMISIKLSNKNVTLDPDINFNNQVDAPLILGFNHPGGYDSHFAQCLFSLANVNSPLISGYRQNVGLFSQTIRPLSDKYPAIIGDTHYRTGINWKGSIEPGEVNDNDLDGTEMFAAFKWNPLVGEADINHYQNSMMSTPPLLNKDKRYQTDWRTDLVTSYVDQVNLDSLGDNRTHKFDIVLKTKASAGYIDNSNGQGIELMAFINQVWVEHQGDIPGANNGYVKIQHYPSQDTLAINRRDLREPETMTLANGQQFQVQSISTGEKKRYEIDADFLNVPLNIYDQFRALLRWQDKGYKLTLHPYLPGVPHCLVGRMEISNEQKNHWDLQRYTFHFKFFEQD